MKKLLLFVILATSVAATAKAQDILNLRMDRNQLGLRGNVSAVDEDLLVRKDYFREDWPTRKWFRSDLRQFLQEDKGHVYNFNNAGRLNSVVYTYKGVAGKRTNCSYAPNGLLTSFVGEGYRVQATYSGNNADINIYAETHSYDPKVDLAHADLAHTPYTNVYPFDMKCRQQLTDDGLVLKSSYYYVDSMPVRVCTYTYTHRGQVAQEKVIDYTREENGDVTVVNYTYDGNGYLVMKKMRGNSSRETYTYINNDHGDCTELTAERPYGTEVYTYEYDYDDQGNWTLRLCYKDGVFVDAVIRTISYYSRNNGVEAVEENVYEEVVEEPTAVQTSQVKGDKGEKKSFTIDLSFLGKNKAAKADKADKPAKEPKAKGDKSAKADKPAKVKQAKAPKEPKAKKNEAQVVSRDANTTDIANEGNKPAKIKPTKEEKAKAKAQAKHDKEAQAKAKSVQKRKAKEYN